MFAYELFKLKESDFEKLSETMSAAEFNCTRGQWYIITAPVDDYVKRAKVCFDKAIELGSAEAKLHLANMYRLGDFGKVDMDEYHRLLNESIEGGCQLAEMRLCKDIGYGVGQTADMDRAIEETKRRLSSHSEPDPRWYDTLGFMFLYKEDEKQANDFLLKAIDAGYIDSYMGLSGMPEAIEKGRAAGCGGCCLVLADELKKKYDECGRNDSNAVECFSDDYQKQAYLDANQKYREELAAQIESLYEEGERLGESTAYYYHGMLYYDATYNHMEDDEKAWACFMRGANLGNFFCMSMLADMIEEGRAPEEYQWEDACLFRLKALRFGDEDQLVPVMEAYFEGDLDDYSDEIETQYKPLYDALEDELCMNPDKDYDDIEDDDGRFDAWA